ncbi:hypothetical protein [Stutzerimonas kunmingensis]|uniref:hypothetical protein n=1 Tax=Stutzerimonas kunmingensis TaxID=1211807 RepID=UPI00289B5CE7|nr:hypothetical protein [Stutzerimonas kunmingensis]
MQERADKKLPHREKEAAHIEKTKSVSLRERIALDGYLRPADKIDKETAKRLGESLYWPDKPCKREHEYWRKVSNGKCLACEHINTVNRRAMPSSGGRSWRAAENRRERLEGKK